jgi:hypothetical protein
MPPRKGGPVEVSQLLPHSLHALCKANRKSVDARPPSAMGVRKRKSGSRSKVCIASIAPLNIHSLAVNSVFMPDV